MYLPKQFESTDLAQAKQLVKEAPFASLISNDDQGFPFVSHIPLHLEVNAASFILLGHVARGNPHWRYLQARPESLVTFLGPHAYMSPRVYPDLARVPTWNYVALHCKVHATVVDMPQDKDVVLKHLIGDHDPAYAAQWRNLDDDYTTKMLMGMVAFRLEVLDWQCKLKLNQHRPESQDSMLQVYDKGSEAEQALAAWIRAYAKASA
jgi:transcriptional regulator